MQTPGTQGATVRTALDDLLRSTVQLPNDESDMLQVLPRAVSRDLCPLELTFSTPRPQSFINLSKES